MTKEAPNAERLDWRTIMRASDDTAADVLAALDAYFEPFAQPALDDNGDVKDMLCLRCGKPLTGMMSAFLGGGFEWGIAHGEGHCAGCRWPARAHHFIKDADGKDVATVHNFVLQYHPDFVTRQSAA